MTNEYLPQGEFSSHEIASSVEADGFRSWLGTQGHYA